jgi:hypothetical protein
MTKNNLDQGARKLRATGVLMLALAIATSPLALSDAVKAQTPVKTTAQTPAKAATSPAGESKGGQKEGIKVHGHWTIDVRNPDGKLATHREFENSLTAEGAEFLTTVLTRRNTFGAWAIALRNTTDVSVPYLLIEETGTVFPGVPPGTLPSPTTSLNFKTLTIVGLTPAGTLQFGLSGNATALTGGTYNFVETLVGWCNGGSTASQCASNPQFALHFTAFVLGPSASSAPVTVSAGQIIQVTVVISFS